MRLLTKAIPEGGDQRETVRALLRQAFGEETAEVTHSENGSPRLPAHPECSISISHCRSYAAILLGTKEERVGVDVEDKRDQTARLLPRYSSPEERTLLSEAGAHPILLWCLKEACYKAFSDIIGPAYSLITLREISPDGRLLTADVEGAGRVTARVRELPGGAVAVCLSARREAD